MAKEAERLYRSDDCTIAGVCAGIAEYCDIDPVIVRILALLLSISSFGLVPIVYVLLWLVMPKRRNVADPISCDAHFYPNSLTTVSGFGASRISAASQPVLQTKYAYWDPSSLNAYSQAAAKQVSQIDQSVYAAHYEAIARMSEAGLKYRDSHDCIGTSIRLAVWIGVLLSSIGFAGLFSLVVEEVIWWQLWPFVVILSGLMMMVLPSRRMSSVARFSCGIALLALGLFLLLMSAHILSWYTILVMLKNLWPLLVIMLGVSIISRALKNELLVPVAALCVVGMFVGGIVVYAVPGTLGQLTVHLPFLGAQVSVVNPWM